MNERSSRSHSVFTLRISGTNSLTKQSCEGSLNLVDLAGSERLNSSGAGNNKGRLKETQNINRSLSALGDVIAALGNAPPGQGDKHIPYRNSKVVTIPSVLVKPEIYNPTVNIFTTKFAKWQFKNAYVFEPLAASGSSKRVLMFPTLCNEGTPIFIILDRAVS